MTASNHVNNECSHEPSATSSARAEDVSKTHDDRSTVPDVQRRSLHLRLFEHREGRIAQFQHLIAIKKKKRSPTPQQWDPPRNRGHKCTHRSTRRATNHERHKSKCRSRQCYNITFSQSLQRTSGVPCSACHRNTSTHTQKQWHMPGAHQRSKPNGGENAWTLHGRTTAPKVLIGNGCVCVSVRLFLHFCGCVIRTVVACACCVSARVSGANCACYNTRR